MYDLTQKRKDAYERQTKAWKAATADWDNKEKREALKKAESVLRFWDQRFAEKKAAEEAEEKRQLSRKLVANVRREADAAVWKGKAGYTDLYVLHAICDIADAAATVEVDLADRRLALGAGVNRNTASRAKRRLEKRGWLRKVKDADDKAHAATYRVTTPLPSSLDAARRDIRERGLPAVPATARQALPFWCLHLWRVMDLRPPRYSWTRKELGEQLGTSPKSETLTEALDRLSRNGMVVEASPSHFVRCPVTSTRRFRLTAELEGVSVQVDRRAESYQRESEVWRQRQHSLVHPERDKSSSQTHPGNEYRHIRGSQRHNTLAPQT